MLALICLENDIENVLIQVRTAFIEGGARLDLFKNYEYSHHEAWSAFYRAATTHGWRVNGLTPEKFHLYQSTFLSFTCSVINYLQNVLFAMVNKIITLNNSFLL